MNTAQHIHALRQSLLLMRALLRSTHSDMKARARACMRKRLRARRVPPPPAPSAPVRNLQRWLTMTARPPAAQTWPGASARELLKPCGQTSSARKYSNDQPRFPLWTRHHQRVTARHPAAITIVCRLHQSRHFWAGKMKLLSLSASASLDCCESLSWCRAAEAGAAAACTLE